jgi:hypothetical protein
LNNEGLLNASPFEIGAVNPGWWRDNDNEEGRVLKQRTPGAVGTRRRRSDYFLVKTNRKNPMGDSLPTLPPSSRPATNHLSFGGSAHSAWARRLPAARPGSPCAVRTFP